MGSTSVVRVLDPTMSVENAAKKQLNENAVAARPTKALRVD